MQIGIGNKRFDQFSLVLPASILIALLFWTLSNVYVLGFLIVFLVITFLQIIRKLRFSYINFDGYNFVIENLLGSKVVLKTELFDRVTPNSRSPLLNTVHIHFKNGRRYKIVAGSARWDEIQNQIDLLIKQRSKG